MDKLAALKEGETLTQFGVRSMATDGSTFTIEQFDSEEEAIANGQPKDFKPGTVLDLVKVETTILRRLS